MNIETNPTAVKDLGQRGLPELAEIVRDEIHKCRAAWSNALDHAMTAGDALLAAEPKIFAAGIGKKKWLKENCFIGVSTALLYMQLASHRAEIEAKIHQGVELSLRGARRLISIPRKTAQPPEGGEEHVEAADVGTAGSTPISPQDPLVIEKGNDETEATPWFVSKMQPIFAGSIKNDPEKSASALSQFREACAALLPQMTVKDLQAARSFIYAVSDIECDVEDAVRDAKTAKANAKRIAWEAKHPDEAKEKARNKEQADAMEDDIGEAQAEARENGEVWSDVKGGWIENWLANNWGEQAEADFENEFQERWQKDHGKPWATLMIKASENNQRDRGASRRGLGKELPTVTMTSSGSNADGNAA